jgi:streptogramin lyase
MQGRKQKLLALAALGVLLGGAALAFLLPGRATHSAYARQASVTFKEYRLPGGQDPWGTAFDSHGNVWIAVPGCDPTPMCNSSTARIEEFKPSTSSWATYKLPSGYGMLLFLAFDSHGNLWFPLPMANALGELVLSSKTFHKWPVLTSGAGPWDLAIDHNGNLWFTEHYTNKIGEFNPATQKMTEYSTPTANSLPYGIVVDAANNIWFTENAVAQIGEYTAGGKMEEYKIRNTPPSGLTPHLITIDPNGNIWWSEGWVTMIGELVVSKAIPGTNSGVKEYGPYPTPCSNCGAHTSGIKVDKNGLVWFDDSLQNIIGTFPDSGTGLFSIYTAPTAGHTHDGLNISSTNVVWFTEEFANKLGKVV